MNEPTIIFGHWDDSIIIGDVELWLCRHGDSWRVVTSVHPAESQYDDFPTRSAALTFFKHAVAEVVKSL